MVRSLLSCFGHPTSSSYASKTTYLPTDEPRKSGPVVVELFSSQGCAASQRAELLFSRIGRGDFDVPVPVILLVYHVDYWDFDGWKDPFGSNQWTVRQKSYVESFCLDTMFTPQVIVQGRTQCVANDQHDLMSAVACATRYPPLAFQAKFQRPSRISLQISLTGTILRSKVNKKGVDIMVALYECGLITNCLKGANKGRILSSDFVVRRLQKLCSLKDFPAKKRLTETACFHLWSGFKSVNCGIVVFVQQHGSHHIFGSQRFILPGNL